MRSSGRRAGHPTPAPGSCGCTPGAGGGRADLLPPTMTDMAARTATTTRTALRPSALELALERVGDRWSLLVVDALLEGPRRYGELQEAVSGIAPNILAERLRRLEREGVVVGRPYQERP